MTKINMLNSTGFLLMTSCLYVAVRAQRLGGALPHHIFDLNLANNGSCVGQINEHPVSNISNSQFFLNITAGSDSSNCIALFADRLCSARGISLQFHNISNKNLFIEQYNPALRVFYLLNYDLTFRSIQQCPSAEDMDGIEWQSWRNRYCETFFHIRHESMGSSHFQFDQWIYMSSDNCMNLRSRDKEEHLGPNFRTTLTIRKFSSISDICLEMYANIQCEGEMTRLMIPGEVAPTEDLVPLWEYVGDAHGRPMIDTDIRSIRKCGPCLKPSGSPDQCNFFNCTSIIDMLALSDFERRPTNAGDDQSQCHFFFNNSQCTSRPIIVQNSRLNLTMMEQILAEFGEFAEWSIADCRSHGAKPVDCLIPLEAGRTLLDLFPVANFDDTDLSIENTTTGPEGPTPTDENIYGQTESIIFYVGVGSLLLLLILLALWMLRFRISKALKHQNQAQPVTSAVSIKTQQTNSYQIANDAFTIDGASCLGSGAFGRVCRGKMRTGLGEEMEDVAVKMVKESCPELGLNGLFYEIKILANLSEHPNIVKLKGTFVENNEIFVFLELCKLGSLKDYLRNIDRPIAANSIGETYYEDLETGNKILSGVENGGLDDVIASDIVRWSAEIANGLEFLAEQRIVHMDIATRNILLSSDKRAKITDFGLSRRLYDYQSYLKKKQEPLPWRWMAPESLRRLEFTEKSDVWAFGITLWEIFTLGDEPYPGLAWDIDFSAKLENGLRLGEPKYNLNGVYSTMSRCWEMNPVKRPTFSELGKLLAQNSM